MRGTAAFSPAPRTRCLQDIILRDATGFKADMPPPTRNNPTTAPTNTTHQDYTRGKAAHSPQPIRELLGFRDGLARASDLQKEDVNLHGGHGRRHLPHSDRSPGGSPITSPRELGVAGVPRPLVHRREDMRATQVGGIIFDAPSAHSPTNSPRGISPNGGRKQYASRHGSASLGSGLDDGRSAPVVHEEFNDTSRAGAKWSQHPTASVELGDNAEINPTSKTLALREDLSKKTLRKCRTHDPADRANELQYRTREVAWGRRSENAKGRWK